MTAEMIWQAGFGLANIALLTGIFYRLGGLTQRHDDFARRLGALEKMAGKG